MRVSVFGLGYVGCVTAACLARHGHQVVGVDINAEKVAMLNAGASPIVEPGLGELLKEVVGRGRLRATVSTSEAIAESDLALVCVGTPSRATGQLDFTAVVRVAEAIGQALRVQARGYTVVLRSTVLPGTTEQIVLPALGGETGAGSLSRLEIAVNPEFMREGSSLLDFTEPPLTLVGSDTPGPTALLRELYGGIAVPFVHTSVRTAEMAKYVANTFHALKISFANEIGDVCEALGADPHEVMRVFLMDQKLNVGPAYLRPGFAFGGSCLPKDLRALLYAARKADLALPLLSGIGPSNDRQIQQAVSRILATRRKRVGVLGLAFKPGTDDLRESPLVRLVEDLIGKGCDVRILDRSVAIARLAGANRRFIEEEIPHIASLMCDDLDSLLDHAEVLVIGHGGLEARRALSFLRPGQEVIDLTRGAARREDTPPPPPTASGIR
jgi:GDP-mannose 6-dehydrogenase